MTLWRPMEMWRAVYICVEDMTMPSGIKNAKRPSYGEWLKLSFVSV